MRVRVMINAPRIKSLILMVLLFVVAEGVFAQATGPSGEPGGGRDVPVTDITFEPADAAHPVCPGFGACPPEDQVTTEYVGFGVDFTPFDGNPPVGVFEDPPEKFGGVNESGDLDLVTPTCGRIVAPGTTEQAFTDIIGIAAGFVSGPEDILLEAYDVNGTLLGSSTADGGSDEDGDLIAVVSDPSASIASFCVSTPTSDSHGVHFIYLNTPRAASAVQSVPTLSGATLVLLVLLLATVAALRFRQF